jgi:hypothetical protein
MNESFVVERSYNGRDSEGRESWNCFDVDGDYLFVEDSEGNRWNP